MSTISNRSRKWTFGWEAVIAIISFAALIVSLVFNILFFQQQQADSQSGTTILTPTPIANPQFVYEVEGSTLQTDTEIVYEVSDGIVKLGHTIPLDGVTVSTNFRIKINAKRSDDITGSVHVQIVSEANPGRSREASWDNFAKDFDDSKVVEFTPQRLVELAGLGSVTPRLPVGQAELPESHRGSFTLEIVRADTGQVIDARTITVLNTPWYHTSALSNTEITAGNPVTVYFSVHNLGQPADMAAIFNVYDTTRGPDDPVASTLVNDESGWWMGRSFKFQMVEDFYVELQNVEEVGYVEYEFAPQVFQPCHVYIIETSARKHFPGIEFSDGDWLYSSVSWWMRDQTSLLTLVVRSPNEECPSS